MKVIKSAIFLFLFPLIIIHSAGSVYLRCRKYYMTYLASGFHNECKVDRLSLVKLRNETFTKVETENDFDGINFEGNETTSLKFYSEDMKYLPSGLEKFFPKMTMLNIRSCLLEEITQNNLKAFPGLINLYLRENLLKVLEKDLFKYNQLLKSLNFYQNMIKVIDPNVFDHLKELNYLNLWHNACIDMSAEDDDAGIKKLIENVRIKCVDRKFGDIEIVKGIKKTKISKNVWILIGCAGIAVFIVLCYMIYRFCITEKNENEESVEEERKSEALNEKK